MSEQGKKITQHKKRDMLMKLIFQSEFQSKHTTLEVSESSTMDAEDAAYITEAYNTYIKYSTEIDGTIMSHLKAGWTIDRLSKTDLAILRVAVLELLYLEAVDAGVAINEAVELTRTYSGEESVKFVNGVLGAIYRSEQ